MSNPWKQQPRVGNTQQQGAGGLKNRFEELAKPEPKPQIIRGKTTWKDSGNTGDYSNTGKFAKSQSKPKKSDFGPPPSITDLP